MKATITDRWYYHYHQFEKLTLILITISWWSTTSDGLGYDKCPEGCTCFVRKYEGLEVNCTAIGNEKLNTTLSQLGDDIRHLYLIRNEIEDLNKLNDTMGILTKRHLRLIDLSLNYISTLQPESFSEFMSLENLILTGNNIRRLQPCTFCGLGHLKILILNDNNIDDLKPSTFEGLNQLQELWLVGNRLQELGAEILKPLVALQYLHVSNNSIITLEPEALMTTGQLKELWLDYNKITWLDEALHQKFKYFTFRNIYLQGNMLRCDCTITWLAIWYQNQIMYEEPNDIPTCASPKNLRDSYITDLSLTDLKCDNKVHPINCSSGSQESRCLSLRNKSHYTVKNVSSYFVCPSGSFDISLMAPRSHISCQRCQKYRTSPIGSQSYKDCVCKAGFQEMPNGTCQPCPIGYFKAHSGNGSCLQCTHGSTTNTVGASTCYCDKGYYLNNATDTCIECPSNHYKNFPGPLFNGAYGCFPCPPTEVSPQGSTSPDECKCISGTKNDGICIQLHSGLHNQSPIRHIFNHSDHVKGVSYEIMVYVGSSLFAIVILAIIMFRFLVKRYRSKTIDKHELRTVKAFLPSIAIEVGYHFLTEEFEIDPSQITLGNKLGEGAFGVVFEAVVTGLKQSNGPLSVAVKALPENYTHEEVTALQSELKQLLYVGKHPNVINLLGCVTSNGCLMLVMEYARHGDLLTFLKTKKHIYFDNLNNSWLSRDDIGYLEENGPSIIDDNCNSDSIYVKEEQLLSFAWQISKGMDYLTGIKCIHRDLATRNVLLSDGYIVKISDFGLARAVYETGYYFKQSKGRLPFKWMAPEAILQGQYTTRSDVWSFGIVLWEIMTLGGAPYPGVPINSLLDLLLSGYRMSRPQHCRPEIYNIMSLCWQEHPSDRPTFLYLMEDLEKILSKVTNKEYIELP